MEHEQKWPDRFAQALAGLATDEDRAALAALRRGLGKPPGAAAEVHRYVVPFLPPRAGAREEDACYLVASLFGLHPRHVTGAGDRPRNLGGVLRRLAQAGNAQSTERRFMALLNADREDLGPHLRRAIALAKNADLALDYGALLRDILDWDRSDRRVQRRWAGTYWAAPAADTQPAA